MSTGMKGSKSWQILYPYAKKIEAKIGLQSSQRHEIGAGAENRLASFPATSTSRRLAHHSISLLFSNHECPDFSIPIRTCRAESPSHKNHHHQPACIRQSETLAPKPRFRWPIVRSRLPSFKRLPPAGLFPSTQSLFRREARPSTLSVFLRLLVGPHKTRRTENNLWDFRHETLPALRHRAQSRLYRAILQRQARRAALNRRPGGGFLAHLLGPRRRSRSRTTNPAGVVGPSAPTRTRTTRKPADGPKDAARDSMAQSGLSSTWGVGGNDGTYAPGSRRKKAYEWLKAANELGQAYTSRWTSQSNEPEDYYHTPGAFPDVEIARSGEEEMVLFPSYARRLTPRKKAEAASRPRRDSWAEEIDAYRGVAEEESDPRIATWDEAEIENAVVDVDVRGWIYAPNRGPMSRKHRLMVKLARSLSGIPVPSGTPGDEGPDRAPARGEDEYVNKQMQTLVDTAEQDADQAWKSSHEDRTRTGLSQATTQMTKDEISMANAHLMERLRPFLTNPVAGMPVTVFFFNGEESESRNLLTDESGHFTIRAHMPFVPTHVRVLASEDLSAAKPIEIIEPVGISLISDIDDTVKHSAIASGAKEMFRNTFVRELAELTVDGVSEWYTQVAKRGVEMHYVSNAPWQLYPLLERYFKLVGLPPGSFHLKQYSGMLQGIFEPTAERKRGSLEQILQDFPERRFILVGDSGEADLEVYTDIVLANPGRILGIFIRDVTTPEKQHFFEPSVGHLDSTVARSRSTPQLVDHKDAHANRPALPPRRPREVSADTDTKSIDNGNLIDLRDDDDLQSSTSETSKPPPVKSRPPPTKPTKPSALRTAAGADDVGDDSTTRTPSQDPIRRKPVPPLPPRRSKTAKPDPLVDTDLSEPISRSRTEPFANEDHLASPQTDALKSGSAKPAPVPPARSKQPPPPPPPRRSDTSSSVTSSASHATNASRPVPPYATKPSYNPPPPYTAKPSYPAAAAQAALQYATERLNLSPAPQPGLRQSPSNQSLGQTASSGYSSYSASESGMPPAPLPNKREELWRRRWERASGILEDRGVVLGSWRVGSDAQSVCLWLVDEALKEIPVNRPSAGAGRQP